MREGQDAENQQGEGVTEVIHCFSVCLPEARLRSLAYQCVRNAVVFPCREHRHQLVERTAHCVITLVTSKGQPVQRACALPEASGAGQA